MIYKQVYERNDLTHSSIKIPFKDGSSMDESMNHEEILKLTNWLSDEMFSSGHCISIIAFFSSIF